MRSRRLNRLGLMAVLSVLSALSATAASLADTAPALADNPSTWSAVAPIPSATPNALAVASGPTGGTLLFASSSSGGNVWPVLAGTGLSSTLTYTAYGNITSQSADYLPNGDAIIAATNDVGTTDFSYRFANGSWGGSASVKNVSSFAANGDELLVTSAGNGASVTSYAISGAGSIAANGAPIKIFSDGTLFGETWTALDPNGSAEVLVNATDEQQGTPNYGDGYMAEIQRLSSGAWQTPLQVPGTANADTNALKVAVAPTGAMIATWPVDSEINYQFYTQSFDAAIREPGGTFGSPVELLDQSSVPLGGQSAIERPMVAAGSDGTLAATATSYTCPDQQVSTDATSSTTLWIAPPGGSLVSYGVPGTTLTRSSSTTVTALGAGGGDAVVGLHNTDVTDPTNAEGGNPWDEASCGEEAGYPSKQVFTDSAVILGPDAVDHMSPTFGSGGQTGTGTVSDVDVDAAAIDPNGNATVVGSLSASGTAQFATFGNVGSASVSPSGVTSNPAPSTPSTPAAPAPAGSTPAGTVTPPAVAPKQTPATVTLITPYVVGQNGSQLVTAANNSDAIENLSIAEYALASGLTNSLMVHPDRATTSKTKTKTKLVKIASGDLRLAAHRSGKVTLHLTRAARRLLAKHGDRLSVSLVITTRAAGHPSSVVTRHLVLRLTKTTAR